MSAFLVANMAPLMFCALVVFLLCGYPVAFALGALGLSFGFLGVELGLLHPALFQALPERIFGILSNDTLLAVPFFTFMGLILERSGMAEDLLDTIGQVFGPIRGGLAYAVIFVGALLAATTGVVAASPPIEPTKMNHPFTVASRDSGNQSVKALIDPIRQAETPRPMSARPSASEARPSARPNANVPAAVTHRSVATTRRGPNRSSSTPSGSWNRRMRSEGRRISSFAAPMPRISASSGAASWKAIIITELVLA